MYGQPAVHPKLFTIPIHLWCSHPVPPPAQLQSSSSLPNPPEQQQQPSSRHHMTRGGRRIMARCKRSCGGYGIGFIAVPGWLGCSPSQSVSPNSTCRVKEHGPRMYRWPDGSLRPDRPPPNSYSLVRVGSVFGAGAAAAVILTHPT
jgi:hypothetical protein